MKLRSAAILVLLCLMTGLSFAQDSYQDGKIVSLHKREAAMSTGGTDAPTASSKDVYDVTIESGGKTYTTVYKSHSDLDPTWAEGKAVQVEVKGKTMYVKRKTGNPVKLAIVSSK